MSAIGATGLGPYGGDTCYISTGTLPANDTLLVNNGYTLRTQGASPNVFINNGAITINSGGTATGGLYLAGELENVGTLSLETGGNSYSTLTNDASGTVTLDSGTFGSSGTIANHGTIHVLSDGGLYNFGAIDNQGTLLEECGAHFTQDPASTYTGTTPSLNCVNPTIAATVTSAHPINAAGWYRSPVTVSFTCTAGGTPIDGSCPAPVHVNDDTAGATVTGTVTDTDKGFATVSRFIKLDLTPPSVTIHGPTTGASYVHPQDVSCTATDPLSGIAVTCGIAALKSTTVGVVKYVAIAIDKAGNTGSVPGNYRIKAPTTTLKLVNVSRSTGRATFKFAGHGYRTGFECSLVKAGRHPAFDKCTSPAVYRHLRNGRYDFAARAVGFGGPDATPVTHSFRIKH
jgi:hypothetical protein